MNITILQGDCREVLTKLPSASMHCCVSSPPYFGLRDYGVDGQIGLEPTPDSYVAELVAVFREVKRVLRDDGVLFLNLGDSYFGGGGGGGSNGSKQQTNSGSLIPGHTRGGVRRPANTATSLKPKDLIGIPWRVAFALQADGWWLRSDIIWAKPNPMPESVTDRPTSAHEHVFLLAKSERYYFDADAVKEEMAPESAARYAYDFGGSKNKALKARDKPTAIVGARDATDGRNIRNVWTIATQPYAEAHFATFPPALVEPCIKAGCPKGGHVLDPFGGAGTVGLVARNLDRDATLIELNPAYVEMAKRRVHGPLFASAAE